MRFRGTAEIGIEYVINNPGRILAGFMFNNAAEIKPECGNSDEITCARNS
jgi:hypothetical protein